MTQVSVIGLGAMGSTLARVLLDRGHEVTVWNRSESQRAAAVAAAGAARAASPAAAVSAAPLTIMCVTDYPAADEVLDRPGVLDELAGRTLVQLTNGTEEQVRAQIARVEAAGGRMLAGGILGYPRHVGRAETTIMYAGDAGAFHEHATTLADLAGAQRYLGEDPGRPNAVYVSAFGFYFAALAGFLEAAALAAERGVAPSEFAAVLPGMAALLLDHVDDATRRIEDGRLRRRPGHGGHPPGRLGSPAAHLRRPRPAVARHRRLRRLLPPGVRGGGGRRGHRGALQARRRAARERLNTAG